MPDPSVCDESPSGIGLAATGRNRTPGGQRWIDGSCSCGDQNGSGPVVPVLTPTENGRCPHVRPGILIVAVGNPREPAVVGEIPAPLNPAGNPEGITTRELRIWPEKKLLIVLEFRCSRLLHACPRGDDTTFPFQYRFFDLTDPERPRPIGTHVTKSKAGVAIKPHEFYLWIDPNDPERALLWESTPSASVNPNRPNLVIEDISEVPSGGAVHLVAEGNWNPLFPGAADPARYHFDLAVHSMTPMPDGKTTYLAYLRGGMLVLDTSEVVTKAQPGVVLSLNDKLLTPIASRAVWGAGDV